MMKCRPLGKCQETTSTELLLHASGYCADTCGKGLKQASVHMLSCQYCGLAVVLWLISVRQVNSPLRDTGMARIKSTPGQKKSGDTVHRILSFDKPCMEVSAEVFTGIYGVVLKLFLCIYQVITGLILY